MIFVMLPLLGALALGPPASPCEGLPTPTPALSEMRAPSQGHPLARVRKPARKHSRVKSSTSMSRCLRLALLQRRAALLHDFLVETRTETPQFRDARPYRLDVGVTIGPVVVTRDFVGSPIIRARVTNLTARRVSFLLSASITSDREAESGASTVVSLRAFETRTIELLCPESVAPHALTWSTMPL